MARAAEIPEAVAPEAEAFGRGHRELTDGRIMTRLEADRITKGAVRFTETGVDGLNGADDIAPEPGRIVIAGIERYPCGRSFKFRVPSGRLSFELFVLVKLRTQNFELRT